MATLRMHWRASTPEARQCMPLLRPMASIGSRIHELRLKDRSGQYRVIYALRHRDAVYVLHAFKKTTMATPKRNLDVARRRLREVES